MPPSFGPRPRLARPSAQRVPLQTLKRQNKQEHFRTPLTCAHYWPPLQDHFFARAFTRFHAHALAKAPYPNFDLLLGGLGAMKAELLWFQVRWHVPLLSPFSSARNKGDARRPGSAPRRWLQRQTVASVCGRAAGAAGGLLISLSLALPGRRLRPSLTDI